MKYFLVKLSDGKVETSERVSATSKTDAWLKVSGRQEKSGLKYFASSLLKGIGFKVTSIQQEHRQNEE